MHDYLHSDDDLLVRLTLKGDPRAFGELVRRYESMVARTVKGMLGDIQQAEDVGQETFIRLYNSLRGFRGDSKLSTYIQKIAINLSLNELKRRKRFVSRFFAGDGDENSSERDIEDLNSSGEEESDLREVLSKAIELLPVEFRVVVVLRLVQGYSTRETADILNLPLGTVLSRLSRAREQLKKEVNRLM